MSSFSFDKSVCKFTLPSHIIETILCLVSIKVAARTSILSKEWRYKWTKIPELGFYDHIFEESSDNENQVSVSEQAIASRKKKMGPMCKVFYVIYQVLLMRQGPIHEFSLSMDVDKTCFEIDGIISYLLRNNSNTLKKLSLHLYEEEGAYCQLPSSVFSFHHLTDLHLHHCNLNHKPTFSGFSRLTSLYMHNVYISTKSLLHLVSNCPLLKHFTLIIDEEHLIDDVDSTITELFKCLPLIEDLSTYGDITECFIIDSVSQELPTSLIHLKRFDMGFMSFDSPDELRFLPLLFRSSPNLEKIELNISCRTIGDEMVSLIREAYSNIWLDHLKELCMWGFSNVKAEMEFVKFMLVKSPKLERVVLCFEDVIDENEETEILDLLAESPPVSPLIEFTVSCVTVHAGVEPGPFWSILDCWRAFGFEEWAWIWSKGACEDHCRCLGF